MSGRTHTGKLRAAEDAVGSLPDTLREVAKWHFRGMSKPWIADRLGLSMETVSKYLKHITARIKQFDDVDKYLKDLIARTGEELTKLSLLEAELWKMHEWASKMVVKVDNFGNPIPVRDHETGQPIPGQFEVGPNKAGYIPIIVGQMGQLYKQRAELLKLIGPKVDVSVNLQFQLETQGRILQILRESAPEVYAQVYRELKVVANQHALKDKENLALPGDTIDAEFSESEPYTVDAE